MAHVDGAVAQRRPGHSRRPRHRRDAAGVAIVTVGSYAVLRTRASRPVFEVVT